MNAIDDVTGLSNTPGTTSWCCGSVSPASIVLGGIDYQDGLVPFGPPDRPHSNNSPEIIK